MNPMSKSLGALSPFFMLKTRKRGCMGVILDKDCITRPNGSKLCFDIKQQKFILFTKKEVNRDDVSKAEMVELIKILTNRGE